MSKSCWITVKSPAKAFPLQFSKAFKRLRQFRILSLRTIHKLNNKIWNMNKNYVRSKEVKWVEIFNEFKQKRDSNNLWMRVYKHFISWILMGTFLLYTRTHWEFNAWRAHCCLHYITSTYKNTLFLWSISFVTNKIYNYLSVYELNQRKNNNPLQ